MKIIKRILLMFIIGLMLLFFMLLYVIIVDGGGRDAICNLGDKYSVVMINSKEWALSC